VVGFVSSYHNSWALITMQLPQQKSRQPANGVASWQDAHALIGRISRRMPWRCAGNSFGVAKLLMSRFNAPAWPSCFIANPAWTASQLPTSSASPSKRCGNGGSVGARNRSPWRISRGRDAPRSFPPEQVAHVKAIACELPAKHGRPLSRFSLSEIVAAVLADDTIAQIGRTTIWRILHQDGLRPWFHKTWIFPRDPRFRERAGPVLDLYQRRWEGQSLGAREFVVSTDEKTSIQARGRIHPTQPPQPRRIMKVEHEYVRGGAVAYLAAWDVGSGRVHGHCESTTGIEPFERLVDAVMTREPYRSADRVFWIADNGSSHRGETARRRLRSAYDNAWLVSLPVHASWLNQVEIWFSLVQRKALTPNDMTSTDEVEERLMKFQDYQNENPKPFNWKFTKENLHDWLERFG
jgi:hypothetical protein